MEISRKASKVVYRNRWMTVREDRIVRASGAEGLYGVVEKPDFAVIAAIDGNRIWLVQQYRYPVGARFWELPQGTSDRDALAPAEVAAMELREETGLIAASMLHVGHLFAAYGYATQGFHVYVARGLEQSEPDRDPEEEGLVAQAFDLSTVEQMLSSSVIKDAATLAAFALLRLKGHL